MSRAGLQTTIVLCCGLPDGVSAATADAWLAWGLRAGVPITWIAPLERLRMVASAAAAAGVEASLALDVSTIESRSRLRAAVGEAVATAPGLEAAAVRGSLASEHRRVLAEAGMRVILRDSFDSTGPGPRRPAPRGWPCRSVLWGLWETTPSPATPPSSMGRLLRWTTSGVIPAGGLAVPELNRGTAADGGQLRARVEQWQGWARQRGPETVSFARLADLPALVAGAGRIADGGSVLQAA
ncbi:MAG: hypothetical protein RLZZ111_918 [Planctomycetota bacterium]|jgi:hypothetical protein